MSESWCYNRPPWPSPWLGEKHRLLNPSSNYVSSKYIWKRQVNWFSHHWWFQLPLYEAFTCCPVRVSYSSIFEFVSCCAESPPVFIPGSRTSFGQTESAPSPLFSLVSLGSFLQKKTKQKKPNLPGTDTEIEYTGFKMGFNATPQTLCLPLCANHSGLKTCNSVSFSTRGRYKHQVNWKVVCTVFGPSPSHGRPNTALW